MDSQITPEIKPPDQGKQMIRVLIVEDQPLVRKGLRMRMELEGDLFVVGEAETGLRAVSMVDDLIPDVVVMDIEMPVMDGLQATEIIHGRHPQIIILILSIHCESIYKVKAFQAGATAFVEKVGGAVALIREIRSMVKRKGVQE
jgi:DNA-binding NarL/FixJ family response regulator